MKQVQIKDKTFRLSVTSNEIQDSIDKVAEKITAELKDKDPLFIVVLNGAFMFAADLFKRLNFPCQISFIKLSSYEGTQTTTQVNTLIGLNEKIAGRTIVIVEDIVDTGITIEKLVNTVKEQGATDVRVASFLLKPGTYNKDIHLDYIAMEIPNDFIVGYGLDYDGYGRNLADIYKITG